MFEMVDWAGGVPVSSLSVGDGKRGGGVGGEEGENLWLYRRHLRFRPVRSVPLLLFFRRAPRRGFAVEPRRLLRARRWHRSDVQRQTG